MPGLSDRLLSRRLRELEEEGLVEREVEAGSPVRVTYSLTEAGAGAAPGDRRAEDLGARVESRRVSPASLGRVELPGPFPVGRYARKPFARSCADARGCAWSAR